MSISNWIVTVADAMLFASALVMLVVPLVLCVLLVLSDAGARTDRATDLENRPRLEAVKQARRSACASSS
jgi:hypothetical protein